MTDLIGRFELGRFVENFLSQLPAVAVAHKTEIRLHRFFLSVFRLYISEHPLFGRRHAQSVSKVYQLSTSFSMRRLVDDIKTGIIESQI